MSCQNYKQYDSRWAAKAYAGQNMSAAGCGPTSTADIVNDLPPNVADWMTARGYASNGSGTYWSAIPAALDAYGYGGQQLNTGNLYGTYNSSTERNWKNQMSTGKYYGILLMGPGVFTSGGHFICITEFDGSRCYVHDPASSARDGWHYWSDFAGCVKVFYLANRKDGGSTSGSSGAPTPSDWHAIGTATCGDNGVNVRFAPNGSIIGRLNKGQRFEVDGYKSGEWIRINVAGIGVGFMHKDYVVYDNPVSISSDWKAIGTAICTDNSVNVRSGPGTSYSSKGHLNSGQRFEVDGETSGSWVHIKVADLGIGWMHGDYVRYDGPSPAAPTPNKPAPNASELVKAGQIHVNNFVNAGIETDGFYGTESRKAAVMCLQHALNLDFNEGLAVDGSWGPATDAAMHRHYVGYDMNGYLVTAWQIILYLNNYNPNGVECPGHFGDGCLSATKDAQADHNLEVDGKAGYNTFHTFLA